MIPKSVDEIVQADIDTLVTNAVEEGNQLDFKQALVGGTRDDKKEFVADVCAFANARGGDLVFGVRENAEGGAQAVVPLAFNADDEILRLESIIADAIEPKLFGVRSAVVEYGGGRILVLRIPRSIQGIHRNKLDERFWVRESKSKRALDVPALATRFQGLAERQDKLLEFLAGRYAAIATGRLPLPLRPGPKAVIHVFQIFAGSDQVIDIQPASDVAALPVPTRPTGRDFRMTFEGPMQHSPVADGMIRAYTLTHHSGIFEGVSKIADPGQPIGAESVECVILQFVHDLIPAVLRQLSVDLPLVVRASLVGGEGVVIQPLDALGRFLLDVPQLSPVDRAALVLPDVVIDSADADLPALFRSSFDRLWHASGFARSLSYQERGGQVVWTAGQL